MIKSLSVNRLSNKDRVILSLVEVIWCRLNARCPSCLDLFIHFSNLSWIFEITRVGVGRREEASTVHWNVAKPTEWISRKWIMDRQTRGVREQHTDVTLARSLIHTANCVSVNVVIIIGEVGCRQRDMTTNGLHRLGTLVIVVRLMGYAFLRLLSQPADYDMLAAPANERASDWQIQHIHTESYTSYHVFQSP